MQKSEQLHTLAILCHASQDSVILLRSIKKILPKVTVPGTTNIQKHAYKSSNWSLLVNKACDILTDVEVCLTLPHMSFIYGVAYSSGIQPSFVHVPPKAVGV
jgi:hypothetical protein